MEAQVSRDLASRSRFVTVVPHLDPARWAGVYAFFVEVCGIEGFARLRPLLDLAEHARWYWPFERACIITPKPSALHLDERGRPHCETGPAIDYGGAWGAWALHGVMMPREVARPQV